MDDELADAVLCRDGERCMEVSPRPNRGRREAVFTIEAVPDASGGDVSVAMTSGNVWEKANQVPPTNNNTVGLGLAGVFINAFLRGSLARDKAWRTESTETCNRAFSLLL